MKNNNLTLVTLLSTLSILVIGTSMTILVYGKEENATYSDAPKFFAIQHAQSGSISEINETAYSLELNDVSGKTILFSDRPDRIFTSDSTTNFIGNWTVGQDSFSIDAPNAVLGVDEQEGQQDTATVELFNPVYDVNKKSLKYEIAAENSTSIDLPSEFGQTTLVIDHGGCCTTGGCSCIPN
ncbi:MAG: hypothetical protein ACPKPY_01320 [Nitrososphaeraceae archaeon]